jgi:hypothetical protein
VVLGILGILVNLVVLKHQYLEVPVHLEDLGNLGILGILVHLEVPVHLEDLGNLGILEHLVHLEVQ